MPLIRAGWLGMKDVIESVRTDTEDDIVALVAEVTDLAAATTTQTRYARSIAFR